MGNNYMGEIGNTGPLGGSVNCSTVSVMLLCVATSRGRVDIETVDTIKSWTMWGWW